jgi:hypothetical protein
MNPSKFEAKLKIFSDASSPDIYDAELHHRPGRLFVISRRRDNTVASYYDDTCWDISAWHPEGRRKILYFNFWKNPIVSKRCDHLMQEARWLIFAIIWLRRGSPLSNGTIMNYMFLVRSLAIYAEKNLLKIDQILCDEKYLTRFFEDICEVGRKKTLCSLLSVLERIGSELLGFSIVGQKYRTVLRARVRLVRGEGKQTPPIPTNIYSEILAALATELTDWQSVADECLTILVKCCRDSNYGRRLGSQKRTIKLGNRGKYRSPEWDDVVSCTARNYLTTRGFSDDVSGLASAVTQIQLVAKLSIQAFTGMRDDEAFSLSYDCASTIMANGETHRLVQGRTTKLTKSPQRVSWVTSKEGHRAIELARQIAAAIYTFCDAVEQKGRDVGLEWANRPLFVSNTYLPVGGRRRAVPADGVFFAGCLSLARFGRMRARLQPTMSEPDIEELEMIDEHRAWRSEVAFQVGRPWTLETHQLRRSLALYAQRSGLVALPSLRRQLQHITDEMTRYYARGSTNAKDIFGLSDSSVGHFGKEWQSTQQESESVSYAVNVLLTDEKLFGGHAAFVSLRLKDSLGNVTAEARAETIKMFKKGQLRYRETIIGGCTRVDECESSAIDWLSVECISKGCHNMVGSIKKLNIVIAEQERLVKCLPEASLLHRTENKNLKVLKSARDQAQTRAKGG